MDKAHRVVWRAYRGVIPSGLDLDHLCRVRSCVNPAHLEPVTRRVNLLRGDTLTARHAALTQCYRGHEMNATNTYVTKRGFRDCRVCKRLRRAKVA
jgi:hypothetical protein